jgi:cytochrome c oxidase subunit 4
MSEHGASQDHDEHHGGSIKTYVVVFLMLCVLTLASFLTYFDFWRESFSKHTGWAFMMAVSCSKAMLVILFFMHLKYEASWKYVLTIPAAFMSVFLVLMLVPDVGNRMERASEERLEYMAIQKTAPGEQGAATNGDKHDPAH